MTEKHTPRPWIIDAHADIISENNEPIAHVYNLRKDYISNIKLIASAPDLLEACKYAHDNLVESLEYVESFISEDWEDTGLSGSIKDALDKIKQAISKATE
jgi:hypothetical protein